MGKAIIRVLVSIAETRIPCPFCGAHRAAVYRQEQPKTATPYHAECLFCSLEGPPRGTRWFAVKAYERTIKDRRRGNGTV